MSMVQAVIKRLEHEAETLQEMGQGEMACGLVAAAKIIGREFDEAEIESGNAPDTSDVAAVPSSPEVLAELMERVAKLLDCEACRGTGKTRGMFHLLDCVQCDGSALVDEIARHTVAAMYRLARGQQALIEQLVINSQPQQRKSQGDLVNEFYANCRSNYRGD